MRIHDLDPSGRGVGRADGKTTFVHGALPGEEVVCRRVRRRGSFDEAVVQEVVEPSPDRVEPKCGFYERCGGCSLQHLSYDAQLRHKERMLLETLSTAGGVSPGLVMPPLAGSPWRYRRKARLGARYVPGRYGALVGFRERHPNRVADMTDCEVLSDPLGPLVMPLRELVGSLETRARIPQIEVVAGEDAAVLVVRHLDPLSAHDLDAIEGFAIRHGIGVWLQPGGSDTARPFIPSRSELHYSLDDGAIRLSFSPLDFVQVNAEVNRALVRRVVSILAPAPGEKVLDAYCGLGNFSLPLAARGADVTGLEAVGAMVERARGNAAANALPASFHRADLGDDATVRDWLGRGWSKLLVDPPRTGAEAVVEHVPLAAVLRRNPHAGRPGPGRHRPAGLVLRRAGLRAVPPARAPDSPVPRAAPGRRRPGASLRGQDPRPRVRPKRRNRVQRCLRRRSDRGAPARAQARSAANRP